jgi:hypothetical protein
VSLRRFSLSFPSYNDSRIDSDELLQAGRAMKAFILMVTWFYYGQPPASSQAEFTSMEACIVARNAVLADAARLKSDSDLEVAQKRAQGIFLNPIPPPTASAVCAAQ